MISGNIYFDGAELPYTISKEQLIEFFLKYKGKAFDFMESLITELKNDENEITSYERN